MTDHLVIVSVKLQDPLGEPPWKANRCAASSVHLDLIGKEKISILINGSEIYCCISHWRFPDQCGDGILETGQQSEHLICCSPVHCSELWHFKVTVIWQDCWELFRCLCPNFMKFTVCIHCHWQMIVYLSCIVTLMLGCWILQPYKDIDEE